MKVNSNGSGRCVSCLLCLIVLPLFRAALVQRLHILTEILVFAHNLHITTGIVRWTDHLMAIVFRGGAVGILDATPLLSADQQGGFFKKALTVS